MAYFVALVSAFLVLSAATALRPGRRGLSAVLAYPVGWAAGELPVQGIVTQLALLGLLAWWGWPSAAWLSLLVFVLAGVVDRRERGPGLHRLLRATDRAPIDGQRSRRAAVDTPHPRRRLRFVVAHGDAVPVPSPRHAAGEERRLRPAGSTTARRMAHVHDAAARAGGALHPRRVMDDGRQARAGAAHAARVRATRLDRRRPQLPTGPSPPVAGADHGRHASPGLGEEERR